MLDSRAHRPLPVRSDSPMRSTSHRGAASLFSALDRSQVQRGIKRSRRDGVTIRRAEQESDLTKTYYDLHLHTRRRHGTPMQPRMFFELLWRRILEPGHGFLCLAYSGRIPVAGAVFLSWSGDLDLQVQRFSTRVLAGAAQPCVDLARDGVGLRERFSHVRLRSDSLSEPGLRDFKRRWAAREEVLHRSVVADTAVQSRSPDGMPERALGAVVRRGPLWLCRGIGEVLYKHAA